MALFRQMVTIDMGSANTVITTAQGGLYTQPSVVALDVKNRSVAAVGEEARELLMRTPGSVMAQRPIVRGRIHDLPKAALLIKTAVGKALAGTLLRPLVTGIFCVSPGAGELELRALEDVAEGAGIRSVMTIDWALAAAHAMGVDISRARGSLICNLGAGKSEFSVVSLSGVVVTRAMELGGCDLDAALVTYIKEEYGVIISESTAEIIKASLCRADGVWGSERMRVRGRDVRTCLPAEVEITSAEVSECAEPFMEKLLCGLREVLMDTPPEIMSDIYSDGIYLCGGMSGLAGVKEVFMRQTGLEVHVAQRPQVCTVEGAAMLANGDQQRAQTV